MKLKYTVVSFIVVMIILLCGCKHVDKSEQPFKKTSPHVSEEISKLSEVSQLSDEVSQLSDEVSQLSDEVSQLSDEVSQLSDEVSEKPAPKIEFYNNTKIVKTISGEWSDKTVLNKDDALSSIEEIKDLLQIKNANKELVISKSYSFGYKMLYTFNKLYNNLKVYGSEIIISVNYENPIPNYLESYLIPDSILEKTDFSENFSEEDIKQKYNIQNIGKYIYAYGEYTDKPIIVYTADIDSEEKIISAVTGEFILMRQEDSDFYKSEMNCRQPVRAAKILTIQKSDDKI